jgi:outer membrane protein assembly factor BamB
VTGKSYIRAYDLKTGNLKWNTEITDAGTDSIAFANGTLYLTTENGVIYAVD